jgi:hypothetical protein
MPAAGARGLLALASRTCAGVSACGSRNAPHERRSKKPPDLVILGIDGFDWNIIDPLVLVRTHAGDAALARQGCAPIS